MQRLAARLMRLTGWHRALANLLLGAVAAQSLPPTGLWPLMLLAVPALILIMDGIAAATRPIRAAFLTGWCFGFGWFSVSLLWIGHAFFVDAATYGWMMPIAIGGLAAYLALWWGLALALSAVLWQAHAPQRILIFAASLAAADWMRGHALTGFPWNAPGYVALDFAPLAQTAALMGLWGVSLIVLITAASPVLALSRMGVSRALLGLVAFSLASLTLWGTLRLQQADVTPPGGPVFRIVQPNIPQSDKWRLDNARAIFSRLLELSASPAEGETPQVILWPESAVPFLMAEEPVALSEAARHLGPGRWLLMGAVRRDPADRALPPDDQRIYNSLIAIDGEGLVRAAYDKWHLVPGGEFLPLESFLAPLGLRRLVTLPGSFTAGPGPMTLRLPGLAGFAPLICYEAIFPGITPQGDERPAFLLNVTNDGWFGVSDGPVQHLGQARMRAIEEGLPLLRAANTGISALIDAHGRIVARLGLGTQGILDVRLPQGLPPTLYARHGDMIFLTFLVAIMLIAGGLQAFAARPPSTTEVHL